jgi:hypothetical protein
VLHPEEEGICTCVEGKSQCPHRVEQYLPNPTTMAGLANMMPSLAKFNDVVLKGFLVVLVCLERCHVVMMRQAHGIKLD